MASTKAEHPWPGHRLGLARLTVAWKNKYAERRRHLAGDKSWFLLLQSQVSLSYMVFYLYILFPGRAATSTFCRNESNVTGLCNRQSCPLANSRYATVRERDGVCYLYKKVIERSHMPAQMWEKIKLKGSLEQVRTKIQKHLEFMPEFYKVKCQARYERIQEYLRRTDRLKDDPNQPILTVKKTKVVRREAKRESRAKKVALVENAIEKELLERLQKGVYGEIYNLPQKTFENILDKHGKQQEMDEDGIEYVEGDEEEEYEQDDESGEEEELEYEEELEPSEVEDLEDAITPAVSSSSRTNRGKRAQVNFEYEIELPAHHTRIH